MRIKHIKRFVVRHAIEDRHLTSAEGKLLHESSTSNSIEKRQKDLDKLSYYANYSSGYSRCKRETRSDLER